MNQWLTVPALLTAFVLVPVLGVAHPESYPIPNPYHIVYGAGHFTGSPTLISIMDDVNSPVGGFYCQDWDADAICGGSGEPGILFCGSVEVTTGVDYDPLFDAHIFVDSALTLFPVCGLLLGGGTSGSVDHTP